MTNLLLTVMNFISDQQRDIVLSNAQNKLINGCAGSHKTDTLIKCAIHDLRINRRPILFLTLIGSVTYEIKTRLEKALNISLAKQGSSNHYLGTYQGIPICISNYDAWVHIMLNSQDIIGIESFYSGKVNALLQKLIKSPEPCRMKGSIQVGLLIIDEVQDLNEAKMRVINNLDHKNLNIYVAGDYLQTLSADDNEIHAMNIFLEIKPQYFNLNICMRCPKGHVDFNNYIMDKIQKKYSIPPMEANNNNVLDKPFLFTHTSVTNNGDARIAAEQITVMIKKLFTQDRSLVPQDVAIIMRKSKDNEVFIQLAQTLTEAYHHPWVYHMDTDADGYHKNLDWEKAKGNTIMLSINGDKGKGHKVVFFLGLTEKSIPGQESLFKPSEIVYESLLNVAITRSTKYLFIGFNTNYPSSYLKRCHHSLNAYAYCSWNASACSKFPQPYCAIAQKMYSKGLINRRPWWDRKKGYIQEPMIIGNKSILRIKGDISKDFEHILELCPGWNITELQDYFGKSQEIKLTLHEEHYPIIGIMAEILIQRKLTPEVLFTKLQQETAFTSDERMLTFMFDINAFLGNKKEFDEYLEDRKQFFDLNPDLLSELRKAFDNDRKVVHEIFGNLCFRKNLKEFCSEIINEKLEPTCIWNVALYYSQLTSNICRPAIKTFFGIFNEKINNLHENINIFVSKYLNTNISFEKVCTVQNSNFTKKDLHILKETKHRNCITGRCDIYNNTVGLIYEVKASTLTSWSHQWLIQIILYALISNVRQIKIVNILRGIIWSWDLPESLTLKDIILKIGKKYHWHHIETNSMINSIYGSMQV